ncbi:MAG: hypothetical protein A2Y38_04280 [Spirochaetes bacterium GWB1_59_5]|nr:MAG: hypothetical protein A2Y38_04280 [Spirochaetes bacterium GWB1_59_5]
MAKSNFTNIMRDANQFVNLSTTTIVNDGAMAPPIGVVFPNPLAASQSFDESFAITQIIVVSTFDFKWILKTNVDALGDPKNPLHTKIYGAAVADVPVSIPFTNRLLCLEDTFINFILDNDMGAPPPPGGVARINIIGYYDNVAVRTIP